MGSGPEFPTWLYASTTKSALTGPRGIPAVPVWERTEPSFRRHHSGVRWQWNAASHMWEAQETFEIHLIGVEYQLMQLIISSLWDSQDLLVRIVGRNFYIEWFVLLQMFTCI